MLTRYWNSASARERLMLAVMVLFVCGALLFAVLVRPAWRLVRDAPATLQTLDAKVLAMRAQAAQLRAAPAALPTVATQPVSAERELSGPGATVSEARDSSGATTVTLKNVDGAKLGAWLARQVGEIAAQPLDLVALILFLSDQVCQALSLSGRPHRRIGQSLLG